MFVGKFGALVQNFRSIALVVLELLKKVVQGGGGLYNPPPKLREGLIYLFIFLSDLLQHKSDESSANKCVIE